MLEPQGAEAPAKLTLGSACGPVAVPDFKLGEAHTARLRGSTPRPSAINVGNTGFLENLTPNFSPNISAITLPAPVVVALPLIERLAFEQRPLGLKHQRLKGGTAGEPMVAGQAA